MRSLLKKLLSGKVATLVVTHEDRLLRFGVDLVRYLCRFVRTEMKVLMPAPEKTFEEELAKDVITLMTVFCARLYGRRSHKTTIPSAGGNKANHQNEMSVISEASTTVFVKSDADAFQRVCRQQQPAYV